MAIAGKGGKEAPQKEMEEARNLGELRILEIRRGEGESDRQRENICLGNGSNTKMWVSASGWASW